MARPTFATIDEYINSFPDGTVKEKLYEMRSIIAKAAPEAEEAISYQIPTFKLNGKFVGYFAGFKDHISFYPLPRDDEQLNKEMKPYVAGKGTLHFALDKPLPKDLITKLVRYWVKIREDGKIEKKTGK
jgi:uncharacterized protein YdhG (YjbR/CyaY superfamily)